MAPVGATVDAPINRHSETGALNMTNDKIPNDELALDTLLSTFAESQSPRDFRPC